MKNLFKTMQVTLASLALVLAVNLSAQAQHLAVNDLIELRSQSLPEVQAALEKKGWVYRGECGGEEETQRYCFKIGDGGEDLAAVLYVIKTGNEQSLEYTVYRTSLISKIQNNIRAGALKLLRQNPISQDVNLRIYQKGEHVLVARGGISKKYYSLQVHKKPAYERMQASR